jgi:hypothetical protein
MPLYPNQLKLLLSIKLRALSLSILVMLLPNPARKIPKRQPKQPSYMIGDNPVPETRRPEPTYPAKQRNQPIARIEEKAELHATQPKSENETQCEPMMMLIRPPCPLFPTMNSDALHHPNDKSGYKPKIKISKNV